MPNDKPLDIAKINAYLEKSAARTRKRLPLALGKPEPAVRPLPVASPLPVARPLPVANKADDAPHGEDQKSTVSAPSKPNG